MKEHPISELLQSVVTKMGTMVDVNLVVGDAITSHESIIIPVSKVRCGFVSGGLDQKKNRLDGDDAYPFGGGAGGTILITPVAFLVCQEKEVKVLHLNESSHQFDRIIDTLSKMLEKVFNKNQETNSKQELEIYRVEK